MRRKIVSSKLQTPRKKLKRSHEYLISKNSLARVIFFVFLNQCGLAFLELVPLRGSLFSGRSGRSHETPQSISHWCCSIPEITTRILKLAWTWRDSGFRWRVSSRVPLGRVLFTISPKWRACSQAKEQVADSGAKTRATGGKQSNFLSKFAEKAVHFSHGISAS